MFRRFSANFAVLSIFLDTFLVAGNLYVAAMLRPDLSELSFVQEIPGAIQLPIALYILFPIIWVGVLLLFSVYDGKRNFRVVDEFSSLSFGSALAAISMAGVLFLTYRDVSRFLFLFFCAITYASLLGWRAIYRVLYRTRLVKGKESRPVLILGAGIVGRLIQEQITSRSDWGLKLVGFLDDDLRKVQNERDVFGTLSNAREIVQKYQVEDVLIALPRTAHERTNAVVNELHQLPVRIWVIPDYFSLTLHHAAVEEFAGIPMLDLRAPALNDYQRMIKRAFDLVFTLMILPMLAPMIALIAVAIKLDSKGPVFFRQLRAGENGKLFEIIKFRTMIDKADDLRHLVETTDEAGNIIHKNKNDWRVTRVGKFLRKTSLDEIPQLFNVLKGDMSLVGPRPEMPYLVDRYEPWQRKRFSIPQGMTGWWQINGRSDKPMHLNTEDDLYYVQHYSIWLDIQILLKTIWVVLRGKGAY